MTLNSKNIKSLLPYIDQAIVSGSNFLLGLLLVRFLGLETYGTFMVGWLAVLFLLSLHQSFFTKPMFTFSAEAEGEDLQKYLSNLWIIQWLMGWGILAPIAFMASLFNPFEVSLEVFPMFILSFFYLLQDFGRKQFFVQKKYQEAVWSDVKVYGFVFSNLLIFNYLGTLNFETLISIMTIGYSLGLTTKHFWNLSFNFKINEIIPTIKRHYHFSIWLLGTSIMQWFSSNFFIVSAAGVLGASAVGILRIGQNIIGLTHVLFLGMENVIPTEASRQFLKNGTSGLLKYIQSITLKAGVIVGLILMTMAVAAPQLLTLFYGAEYAEQSFVVVWYCILYVFVFFGYPARFILRTLHETRPIFIAYALTAIICSLTAYPIVENFGLVGCLVGLLLCQIITLLVYIFFMILRLPDFRPFRANY